MTTYLEILDTEIDVDSPITTGLMTKIRDNPIATAERDTANGAPQIIPQNTEIFTSSGTWTKPTGVKFVDVIVTGAGGTTSASGSAVGTPGDAGDTVIARVDVSAVSSVTVTVGAASTSAAATFSSFGSFLQAKAGDGFNGTGTGTTTTASSSILVINGGEGISTALSSGGGVVGGTSYWGGGGYGSATNGRTTGGATSFIGKNGVVVVRY